MSIFELYLRTGIDHICDFQGYDHILFILSLTVMYPLKYWKKLLILITAFTVGHSLTLAMATLNLLSIPTGLIEFLIPVTIFLTALLNTAQNPETFHSGSHKIKYAAALFFGLIHRMGFSNYLRSLLSGEESLFLPLLSFNLGIELGQIMIVLCITAITLLVVNIFGIKRRSWVLVLSGAAMGISLIMAIERIPG